MNPKMFCRDTGKSLQEGVVTGGVISTEWKGLARKASGGGTHPRLERRNRWQADKREKGIPGQESTVSKRREP